jgi:hypothetical protein
LDDLDRLKEAVHGCELGSRDQLLLVLSADDCRAKSLKEIKTVAGRLGLRWTTKVNLSDRLAKSGGLAIRTTDGWELSPAGKSEVSSRLLPAAGTRVSQPANDLRAHLTTIKDSTVRSFVEEAIACCEQKLWRAAVVLSWCGAVAILQAHVVAGHLSDFNAEAKRRDPKWRDAKKPEDIGRMKEHDFLDVLAALSILGKNVKQELQDNCLNLRNGCGHPNSLTISAARVAAHLEILILNVFSRF